MAAAADLGLTNKTQNGFTFWGLAKPTRTLDDPEAALKKACARFLGLATAVTESATDEKSGQDPHCPPAARPGGRGPARSSRMMDGPAFFQNLRDRLRKDEEKA